MANEYIADGIYRVSGLETTLKNGSWVSDAGTYLVTGQAKLASIPGAQPGDVAFTAGYTQIWQLDTDGTTWVELPKTAATTAAAAAATSATEAAASAAAATAVKNSIPQDYTTLSDDVVDLKSAIGNTTMGTTATTVTGAIAEHENDISGLTSGKVNKPSSSPNGTNGQLLRTNGDGTTTWVDQGLPTDVQTATAVSAWLTAHPEATTTVEDHSLTYDKLVIGTLGFVTPEMYGASGDGETDDTEYIEDAIESGYPVIGSGTYLITSPIVTQSNIILRECNIVFESKSNATRMFVSPYIDFENCSFTSQRDKTGATPSGHSMAFVSSNVILSQSQQYIKMKNCKFSKLLGVVDVHDSTGIFENLYINNCDYFLYSEDSTIDLINVNYSFSFGSYNDGYHFVYAQDNCNVNIRGCNALHNGATNIIQAYGLSNKTTITVYDSFFDGERPLYGHKNNDVISEVICYNCIFKNYNIMFGGLGSCQIYNSSMIGTTSTSYLAANPTEHLSIYGCDIVCKYVGSNSGVKVYIKDSTLEVGYANTPGVYFTFENCNITFDEPIRTCRSMEFRNCKVQATYLLAINQTSEISIIFDSCSIECEQMYFTSYSESPMTGEVQFYASKIKCDKINANSQTAIKFVSCEIVFTTAYANLVNYSVPLYLCATKGMIRGETVTDQGCVIIS